MLRGTYVIPVYHDGFLYGMSGRITLTCVDAATGALRWRSREPGDGFPLLVGDDLVVLTKERTLHVGKASPEGWTERARIELFKDVVWSPPGFAEGAVFARSQGELARVEWRVPEGKSAAPAAAAPRPASQRFARFLDELSAAQDKPAAVDRFLASIPPGPLVEWPDRVVFLYRGAATDAGIVGRHERGPPRGPDVARSRHRPLLVRGDARARRARQLPLRARLRGAASRSPQSLARPWARERRARAVPEGAVLVGDARLARRRITSARPRRRDAAAWTSTW